jgi:2-polyprenyl-6-methoxyphenol hydroxylase-like FAD-dependent oxidoreductase
VNIVIVGAGIGGLTLALMLERVGLAKDLRVYEAARELKPLGVGINMQPHAVQELDYLGLVPALRATSVEAKEFAFFTARGQHVYSEPCGLYAGYGVPHFSVHRGDLQQVLFDAVCERLGENAVVCGHRCAGVEQDADGSDVRFVDPAGLTLPTVRGDIVIAADGIHSAVRKQLYPNEGRPLFHGINMWRGVTRHPPFLTGASVTRIGGLNTTGKIVVYPVRNDVDGAGNQLINWNTEVVTDVASEVDWNGAGRLEDFMPIFEHWRYDWLDVAQLIRDTEFILSFPMVDRDPVDRYAFGRVALMGDAAHPMYPRGGNGGAQAIIDARAISDALLALPPVAALAEYDRIRVPFVSEIVRQNRTAPPDIIIDTVERLTGGARFENIADVIDPAELARMSLAYKQLVRSDLESVGTADAVKGSS